MLAGSALSVKLVPVLMIESESPKLRVGFEAAAQEESRFSGMRRRMGDDED